MSSPAEITLQPFFLRGSSGRLLCTYFGPAAHRELRGTVLFVPAFAEEMNKTRRQVVLQARALAASGCGALLVDLFGTGDSEGTFGEARWDAWVADLAAAAAWLTEHGGGGFGVCAVRLGSLLAKDLVEATPGRVDRLVLWHPVIDGRQYVDQFLRLKTAAAMAAREPGMTVRSLRETLASAGSVEVAGYELHAELSNAIDSRRLQERDFGGGTHVVWLELVQDPEQGLAPVSQRIVAAWGERGIAVDSAAVVGPRFWSTVETTTAPDLVERTTRGLVPPP